MTSSAKLPTLTAAAVLLFGAPQLAAQGIRVSEQGGDVQAQQASNPGYAGVKPGGAEAPAVEASPGATPAAITWPGFSMRPDGGSRVFLQITSQVNYDTVVSAERVVIDLGDVRVVGSTNRYPLYTQYFNTPVSQVSVVRKGSRTLLVLKLRAPAQPTITEGAAASGFHFIYVDFPAGNFVSGALAPMTGAPDAAPSQDADPSHLDGDVEASGSAKAKARLRGKAKAKGKARGKAKAGGGEVKAEGKAEGKAGFSFGN
ncbi:MAG: hypothetical protein OEZ06_17040 [Myxococcales bacterium]|nr:hypothetical protein [Myxococcales bacterium]